MRNYLLVLNVINAFIFIWLLIIFNSIFDFTSVLQTADGELVLASFIDGIRLIFIYLIYYILYIVGYFSALVTSGMFGAFPGYQSGFMFYFLGFFFKNFLNLWFSFPGGVAPELNAVPGLITHELLVFGIDFYLLIFQILFLVAIIFFLRAILQNDPRFSLVAVGCLVLMIVIPLMIFGFGDMLNLFGADFRPENISQIFSDMLGRDVKVEALVNPVDPSLTDLPVDDIFAFFASPIALMAIVAYIYLEISFQINYTDTVTKPSLERKGRLEAQLRVLQRESQQITANVDKIKEEAKEKLKELEAEEKEQVGKFFGKAGERFSYVKEMIMRRKLEDEEKQLITAASKTRRLGRYVERLFREDPEAEDTLTAKTSAPRPKSLATSTLTTFTFRVGLLIFISYIIIHPRWFLINVFQLPPAITESVGMYSPEVIIILLGPIMLLFPIISWLISYVKHRNLIIRLKQEGRIKEILASVGDYVKIDKEEGEEGEEEEKDKDAEPVMTEPIPET